MTEEYDEFVSVIKINEAVLGELRSRMRAVLNDESLPVRSRVAEYRKLLNETKPYAEDIERAWDKLNKTL
jgi:hypothetical protein